MGYLASVINGNLHMRQSPDGTSPILKTIPNGTTISIANYQNPVQWAATVYGQRLGYVLREYLSVSNTTSYVVEGCIEFGASNLREGRTGQYVLKLQNFLNQYNHANIAQDGDFGPTTKQAVINYQSDRGLYADGIVGNATKEDIYCNIHFG